MKKLIVSSLVALTLASITFTSYATSRSLKGEEEAKPILRPITRPYSDSPFKGFLARSWKNNSHYVTILNNGDDALLARIDLIRKAKESILIQTFIWGSDETSRFVVYELIQAAKRGVKVKIILDYLISSRDFELITFLTTAHPNLEIKLYNPIS